MSQTTVRISPSALARYRTCPRSHFYHLSTPVYADWVSPHLSAHKRFEIMANLCLAGQDIPARFAESNVFARSVVPIISEFTKRGYTGSTEVNIETSIAGDMLDELWEEYAFHLYTRADLAFMQEGQLAAIVDYKFLSGERAVHRYIGGLGKSIQHLFYRYMVATSAEAGEVMYVIVYPQDDGSAFYLHRERVTQRDWTAAFSALRPHLIYYLRGWVLQKNINTAPIYDDICQKCLYSQICEYPQGKDTERLNEDAYESLLIENSPEYSDVEMSL